MDLLKTTLFIAMFAAFEVSAQAQALKAYQIDPAKSAVNFSIDAKCRLLPGGYTVLGHFSQISGTIQSDSTNILASKVQVELPIETLQTQTVNPTGCAKVMPGDDATRDEHLKSADFFDLQSFAQATFKSLGSLQQTGQNEYLLKGKFTIKGVPQMVLLALRPVKSYRDGKNQNHLVYEAQAKLDRMQFGVGPESGDITGLGSAMISVANELTLSVTLDAYEVAQ